MSASTSQLSQAELGGAAGGRVGVEVGAGGDLDAGEERGVAQVGHRDVAAADDADPQLRRGIVGHGENFVFRGAVRR